MKIALIEVKPRGKDYIAKEMAGGLGKKVRLENNLAGALLSHFLTSRFSAPPIVLAQIAGICFKHHHETESYYIFNPRDIAPDTEIAFVVSSMEDYSNEVNFIKELKASSSAKVIVVGSFD